MNTIKFLIGKVFFQVKYQILLQKLLTREMIPHYMLIKMQIISLQVNISKGKTQPKTLMHRDISLVNI